MESIVPQTPKDKTGLPLEEVLHNEDLANRAPDSTRDNTPRPHAWKPPLVTKEDYKRENPYSKHPPF